MKNHFTTTFLNVLLCFLVLSSVAFTILVIHRETKADDSAQEARQANNSLVRVNAILNDTANYNATAHDAQLAHILQFAQDKPASH